MGSQSLLIKSLFLLFAGYFLSVFTILNKNAGLFAVMESYFVVFMFMGIIISLAGTGIMVIWEFKNSKPFLEDKEQTHYAPLLAFGIIFILSAFTLVFYIQNLDRTQFSVALALILLGIILLVVGLKFFIEEVMQHINTFNQKAS